MVPTVLMLRAVTENLGFEVLLVPSRLEWLELHTVEMCLVQEVFRGSRTAMER